MRQHRCRRLLVCARYVTLVAIAMTTRVPSTESIVLEKLTVMTGEYSGTFSSPGYPKPYPVNLSYTWIFPKYDHDVVLLDFVDMNLYRCYVVDLDEMCDMYDHVSVEGHQRFCNWRVPKGVLKFTERTVVKFRTFPSRKACRGRGFNASFRVVSAKIHNGTATKPLVPTLNSHTKENTANPDSPREIIIVLVLVFIAILVVILSFFICWCYKRKKSRLARRNRSRTRSYSSVPAREGEQSDPQLQGDVVSYSDLLRNEGRDLPRAQGPPPSYDSVINPGSNTNSSQRENANSPAELENPPSYESVLRERHTRTERRHASYVTSAPENPQGGQEPNISSQSQNSNSPRSNDGNNSDTITGQNDDVQSSRDQQENVRNTAGQSLSRNSPHRTRGNRRGISTNQRRISSTSRTTSNSNPVENSSEPSAESQPSGSRDIVVTESSNSSPPDDSRREVFV